MHESRTTLDCLLLASRIIVLVIISAFLVFPVVELHAGETGAYDVFIGYALFGALFFIYLRASALNIYDSTVQNLGMILMTIFGLAYGLGVPAPDAAPMDAGTASIACAAITLIICLLNGMIYSYATFKSRCGVETESDKHAIRYADVVLLCAGAILIKSPAMSLANEPNSLKYTLAVACILIGIIAYWVGKVAGRIVNRWIDSIGAVLSIVRRMGAPAGLFLLGYLMIGLIFASIHVRIYVYDKTAYGGDFLSKAPSFLDFVYFSFVTMATTGYGDILPVKPGARLACVAEVVVGVLWVTVILAAIVSRINGQAEGVLTGHVGKPRVIETEGEENPETTDDNKETCGV